MARYLYAPAGVEAATPEPGDLILTHNPYWTSRIIRFGQRLRYPAAAAFYNHVAVAYDSRGSIVEALGGGVVKRHVSVYEDTPYYVVKIGAGSGDRRQVVNFLDAVLEAKWRYGYLTIASVALTLLTGYSVVFARSGTAICSGLASEALTRCGEVFDKPPAFVIPADLAEHFGIPIGRPVDRCDHAPARLCLDRPDWSYRWPEAEGGCGLGSEHHEGPQAALEGFKKLAPGFEAGDTHYSHARSFLLGGA